MFSRCAAQKQIQGASDQCHRQNHLQVEAELVTQPAALRLRRDDRRIADQRQVVAEERSADHGGDHNRHSHLRSLRQACRDRHQRNDRAHTRTHAQRGQTGGYEQPRQRKPCRQKLQRQIHHRSGCTHLLRTRSKRSR
jgi:hypothetical protein